MTETTTAAKTTASVVKDVAKKVADDNVLPAVAEVTEVAVQVPSKFIVSSKFVAGVVGGVAVGAGAFYGIQKLRERLAAKKAEKIVVPNDASELTDKSGKDNKQS